MEGLAPLGPWQRERSLREGEISKPRCINGEQGGWFTARRRKSPARARRGQVASCIVGLPTRRQTRNSNTEPTSWFLCRKSDASVAQKTPRGEAGLPIVPTRVLVWAATLQERAAIGKPTA
jgi:hypothetical protein